MPWYAWAVIGVLGILTIWLYAIVAKVWAILKMLHPVLEELAKESKEEEK